jgi:hypothetical protein
MGAFRVLLVVVFVTICGYTAVVVANHGSNLFPVFFGDIGKVAWAGQFNLDFMGFLTLSALWLAWRHQFSPLGCMLGVLGFFGGAPLLTAYLLYQSFAAKGDVRILLLGEARADLGR